MIKISIYRNDELLQEFEQEGDKEITVGRAAGCSIHLDEASVSRLHAILVNQGGGWSVVRKANFGAVLLNGQEIENAPIEGGEELAIGEFSLRINLEGGGAKEKSVSVVASQSMEVSEDGGTKIMTAGVNGLLRFEPGTANVAEFLMEQPLAVFGRGSNCDVVLTEKKASRKHFEIRKQGLSFILKDLNSANGVQVNGRPVQEQELVSGDVIQIGEAKIQFSVENRDYFSKQDQFMPVPAHLEQSLAVSEPGGEMAVQYGADGNPIESAAIPGVGQAAPAAPPPASLLGKAKFWYSSLPKERRLRLIALFTALALLGAIFGTGDDAPKKRINPKGPGGRVYENLTPEKKKFVRDNYEQLNKAYATRDYPKMLEFTGKILTYVDDYNDTKNYEMIAKKGIEQQEEEKRKAELEKKQAQTRKEVAALEEKGRALLAKALDDPKFRPELDTLIQEIYAKDPNNRAAADWKAQIKAKDEEDKRLAEDARKKEEIKQRAEAAFADVEKTFKEEKYIQALAQAETLYEQEYKEKAYTERIDKLKDEIRTRLSTVITPYLREAEAQRQEGGDLVKAKEAYMQVLKIDATNKEARRGLDDIHDKLHLRAKRYYNEAILADSMSDLVEAKEKYEKCLHSAPDDKDIYRVRCRSKLSRFEAFTPESTGGGQ